MTRSNSLLRPISFFLLQSFIFQQISFAEVLTPLKENPFEKPKVNLSIPESVATIEDAWDNKGQNLKDKKLVYLIQDAHTNESGQLNLSKALDIFLTQDKALKYVFTEAGVNDNSLSFLRPFRPLKERQALSLSYLKQGLLHGTEYLDLTSDHSFTLWGVESPDLYIKSLEDYKAVAKDRERFDLYLKKIDSTLNTLKPRFFNPSLLQFDQDLNKFEKEDITLTQFFQVLLREATLHNIDLKAYPHLKNLGELKAKEEAINFQKANEEQLKAVSSLSNQDQAELKDLTESQSSKGGSASGGNSPFKLGMTDSKEAKAFYTLLEEKLTSHVIARSEATKESLLSQIASSPSASRNDKYPNLFKYLDYLKLAKQIEAKHVLLELKALKDQVLTTLSKTDDEKTLIKCQIVLRHLEKLFHLTLTPEEFKEYKDLSLDFKLEHLTGFLNKKIMDLNTYYERSLFLEKGYEDMVKRSEDFYALTLERDQYFVSQMLNKMTLESQSKAVLVTGGFHTTDLKAILKDKGISFVSITPQVLKETNMKRYENILLNQRMETSTANIPSTQTAMHMDTVPAINAGVLPVTRGARLALEVMASQAGKEALGARLADTKKSLENTELTAAKTIGARMAGPIDRRSFILGSAAVLGAAALVGGSYHFLSNSRNSRTPEEEVINHFSDLIRLFGETREQTMPDMSSSSFLNIYSNAIGLKKLKDVPQLFRSPDFDSIYPSLEAVFAEWRAVPFYENNNFQNLKYNLTALARRFVNSRYPGTTQDDRDNNAIGVALWYLDAADPEKNPRVALVFESSNISIWGQILDLMGASDVDAFSFGQTMDTARGRAIAKIILSHPEGIGNSLETQRRLMKGMKQELWDMWHGPDTSKYKKAMQKILNVPNAGARLALERLEKKTAPWALDDLMLYADLGVARYDDAYDEEISQMQRASADASFHSQKITREQVTKYIVLGSNAVLFVYLIHSADRLQISRAEVVQKPLSELAREKGEGGVLFSARTSILRISESPSTRLEGLENILKGKASAYLVWMGEINSEINELLADWRAYNNSLRHNDENSAEAFENFITYNREKYDDRLELLYHNQLRALLLHPDFQDPLSEHNSLDEGSIVIWSPNRFGIVMDTFKANKAQAAQYSLKEGTDACLLWELDGSIGNPRVWTIAALRRSSAEGGPMTIFPYNSHVHGPVATVYLPHDDLAKGARLADNITLNKVIAGGAAADFTYTGRNATTFKELQAAVILKLGLSGKKNIVGIVVNGQPRVSKLSIPLGDTKIKQGDVFTVTLSGRGVSSSIGARLADFRESSVPTVLTPPVTDRLMRTAYADIARGIRGVAKRVGQIPYSKGKNESLVTLAGAMNVFASNVEKNNPPIGSSEIGVILNNFSRRLESFSGTDRLIADLHAIAAGARLAQGSAETPDKSLNVFLERINELGGTRVIIDQRIGEESEKTKSVVVPMKTRLDLQKTAKRILTGAHGSADNALVIAQGYSRPLLGRELKSFPSFFSVRTLNALRRYDKGSITTVGKLSRLSFPEAWRIPNLGPKGLAEIAVFRETAGLSPWERPTENRMDKVKYDEAMRRKRNLSGARLAKIVEVKNDGNDGVEVHYLVGSTPVVVVFNKRPGSPLEGLPSVDSINFSSQDIFNFNLNESNELTLSGQANATQNLRKNHLDLISAIISAETINHERRVALQEAKVLLLTEGFDLVTEWSNIESQIDNIIRNNLSRSPDGARLAASIAEPPVQGRLRATPIGMLLSENAPQLEFKADRGLMVTDTLQRPNLDLSDGTIDSGTKSYLAQLTAPFKTRLAHASEENRISVFFSNGQLLIFNLKLRNENESAILDVTWNGRTTSLEVQEVLKNSQGKVTAVAAKISDLINLARETDAAVVGELEFAEVNPNTPVLFQVDLGLFDFGLNPEQFDIFAAQGARISRQDKHLSFQLLGDENQLNKAGARLAALDATFADFHGINNLFSRGTMPEWAKKTESRIVKLFRAGQGIPDRMEGTRYVPMQFSPDDALSFVGTLSLAKTAGRIELGKGSIDRHFKEAWRILSGGQEIDDSTLRSILAGLARPDILVKHALKALMKFGLNDIARFYKTMLATAYSA